MRPSARRRKCDFQRRLKLESLESRRLLTTLLLDPNLSTWPAKAVVDDSATIIAGEVATIDLLQNDVAQVNFRDHHDYGYFEFDLGPGLAGTSHRLDSVSDPMHGSHQLLSDGRTIVYTPDEGFTGIDQFTYTAVNSAGGIYEANVTINVVDPIAAIPDWFRVDQGEVAVLLDPLANDGPNLRLGYRNLEYALLWEDRAFTDPDPLKITSVSAPSSGGSVSISDDESFLVYAPGDDFVGLETLTYTIADADGFTATTSVDIRVTASVSDDSGEWHEWWKHQAILASLNANSAFGQPLGSGNHRVIHDRFLFPPIALPTTWEVSRSADFFEVAAFSTFEDTNAQVVGVDQGDLVKTDGRYIYVIHNDPLNGQSRLSVFDASDPAELPLVSQTPIEGQPLELYIMDDAVLLISQAATDVRVTTIEVIDRAAPGIQQTSTIPGRFSESRMIDGVVQIYTTLGSYELAIELGSVCSEVTTDACFYETRQQFADRIVGDESLWKGPAIESRDAVGNSIDSIPLNPYIELVTANSLLVATLLDASGPITGTVLGSAEGATIYVSSDSVYVFSLSQALNERWEYKTNVNQFDLANGNGVTWAARGTLDGEILNSFSIGHYDASIYVAVTSGNRSNSVQVLQQNGKSLNVIGQTEPLAPGEEIYSARFVENRGYVVTFRRVDPLFVIDLSDPEHPTVSGELKTPGYSQYLHPIDGEHLIGIGRDADDRGWAQGMQISLFDATDAQQPTLKDKLLVGDYASPLAESNRNLSDHRAFSYFASHQILALPVYPSGARWTRWSQTNSSVLLLHIDAESGIERLGTIAFDDSRVLRTLRIGDVIFSVSNSEIQAHDLNNPSVRLARRLFHEVTPVESTDPTMVDPTPVSEIAETVVRIDPHFIDRDGQSIETIEAGQTVWLEVTAADARQMKQLGVFSAYFDIDFADASVELAGESEFSDAFWVLRRDPADHGWNDIGASQGLTSEADPLRPWILRIPIQFDQAGDATVQLTPSDWEKHPALVYGSDLEVPVEAVEFGNATITVTESARDPMDVNGDGMITLVDPLNVINRLMERKEAAVETTLDISRYDVNGDGRMTANDAVILINYIENKRAQAQALAEWLDDEDEADPMIETKSALF